ncbi:MAG TPA: ATP-binding protein [Oceanobacillus sp.]|nr:ATP-binding protein [Oceanobacillus sp.]
MAALNTVTLLINGLTLALALSFLIIILWNDARKELNQFFAAFLFLVALWNVGSLLAQAIALIEEESPLLDISLSVMEVGFTGSSVAIYALTAGLVKLHTRRFRVLTFASLFLILVYRIMLIAGDVVPIPVSPQDPATLTYQERPLLIMFYLIFDGATLYLLWRYRRKIHSYDLQFGIFAFVIGQSLGFLNPELQTISLSVTVSALATLVICFAIVRQEIIRPLAERNSQVEAIRKVSTSITSQSAITFVLDQIASQAAELLGADGVGIFLKDGDLVRLETVYNLPKQFSGAEMRVGEGVAGRTVETQQVIQLDDYGRDWRGKVDLPLAKETFGSVICTPLIYGGEAIGALMIVAGRHGKLFEREDVYLLQLLGAQASVAIAHSRLFAEQVELTRQVEFSRSQLETVLVSTESPVIAVDRKFKLIFANPAARVLFSQVTDSESTPIYRLLPSNAFPPNYRELLREVRRNRAYSYEVVVGDKIYLCHAAPLGKARITGWVAVLNDITQLKELDRLKSEMVRMTSHDLKNPLQAAMANVELLREDVYEIGDEEVRESITVIDKQLHRMNRIIRGILDLERIKNGTISLEICHPMRIINDTIEEMRHLAEDQHVQLETNVSDDLPVFHCDVEQFERAIINLVENAVKFTPAGGRVCLSTYQEDDQLIFEVEDTGVGISEELQARVFDRFYRAKQKGVEHISGSGLGLSLVKTIVENHRGKVWLESKEGVGTRFYVAVPFALP